MRERIESYMKERFGRVMSLERLLRVARVRKLSTELRELIESHTGSLIDPVTGLVQRNFFFRELTAEIERQFPKFEAHGTLDESTHGLTVVVGDLAFLNYFNSISHSRGDEVLKRAASILAAEFKECWVGRLGGDEFGLFTNEVLDHTLARKNRVEEEVSGMPYHYLDLEYATVVDAETFLKTFPLPKTRRIKFLTQVLTDIAMTRAQIAKYYKRISILVEVYLAGREAYEELITFARKGAGNITDKDVSEFAHRAQDGMDISLDCLQFAIYAKAGSMRGDPYNEAIMAVAESIFMKPEIS